jgi:glycosyltransferase involved in cell wall biosynthesis
MKVAMVAPGYPPDVGGVEVHVARLANALAALGHEVEVLAQSKAVRSASVSLEGGVVIRRWPVVAPSADLALSFGLFRFLHGQQPAYDVVHAHNYHSAAPLAALLSGRSPLVTTPHYHGSGASRLTNLLHVPYVVVGRRILRRSKAIIAVSRTEAHILRCRFPFVCPHVIPNGVDVERFGTARPKPCSVPVILSVGRLVAYKHTADIIAALPFVPDVELVVIGVGPESGKLASRATELGVSGRVRFMGNVSDDELTEWYVTASLLVTLSRFEAFGIAPIEALAAGTPVIASDISAHRELAAFDEYHVLRVFDPAAGPRALAQLIRSTLARGKPPPSGLVPSWNTVARMHESLYSAICPR